LMGLQNPFDIRMGVHWKQWQAWRVVSLQQDWDTLREGSDKFLCVYIDRWSWTIIGQVLQLYYLLAIRDWNGPHANTHVYPNFPLKESVDFLMQINS
jgi:hypothetical protein